jgi:pimeloyl-ACP methyl ester carboxylesterase
MSDPTITFVEVMGIKTAQVVAGEGLPLLMLHGWGANISLLWPLAERLLPLGYKVYIPDLPGFGQSALPPTAWSVFDYANFVLAYMDCHQLDKIYLFGHSFGGRLSMILGAEHPERFVKIVLVDSAGVRSKTPLTIRVRTSFYKFIRESLNRMGQRKLANNLREWYGRRYASADYQNASGVMRETFVKVVNEDLLPYAAQVTVPTFMFWGENDQDTPLWQGQLLEKTIPDSGLHVFRGAGHYSYLEQLADTMRIMDYFFKQA